MKNQLLSVFLSAALLIAPTSVLGCITCYINNDTGNEINIDYEMLEANSPEGVEISSLPQASITMECFENDYVDSDRDDFDDN